MAIPPIQTRLPGEQYLKTFNAKFRVHEAPALRTTPFAYQQPLPTYRSVVFSQFQASKGMLLDVHA